MSHRRLAAIMFTDIIGYTSLMGKDEDLAFNLIRKNLRIQKSLIRRYDGHFLKEIGDGILASFPLASDAVKCAKSIQTAVFAEGYELRIGIHTGEMILEKDDAWGDSVNVASRLQELGDSGSILISGTVYKDIKNQKGFSVNFVDEKLLKNVEEPVKVYKVDYHEEIKSVQNFKKEKFLNHHLFYLLGALTVASLLIAFLFIYKGNDSAKENTIAVLYTKNTSNLAEDQPFCDGLTVAIINTLASISELNVLPSESVRKFKDSDIGMDKIVSELNVNYVLSIEFYKSDDRISLSPSLYSVKENKIEWTPEDQLDWISEPEDLFTYRLEVAQRVADVLNIYLSSEEEKLISKKTTPDAVSYDYYLNAYSQIKDKTAQLNSGAQIKFLLNWIHDPTFTGEYIALEKFWRKNENQFDLLQGGVGINPISMVENHIVDYAIVGADKALIAISNNAPIRIISVDQQRNPVGWIVRSSLGITSFKDIQGRKDIILGDKSGTEISSILQLILKRTPYDLNPQAVNYDFDYFLTNKNVVYPVYLNEEPEKAKLIHSLSVSEIDPSLEINGGIKLYGNVLITHQDKVKTSLSEVHEVIDGIIKGWEFASENPDEAVKIVNKYVKHDERYVKAVMKRSVYFAKNKYGEEVPPGHMDKKTWLNTIDVLNEAGILTKEIDIDKSIYLKR